MAIPQTPLIFKGSEDSRSINHSLSMHSVETSRRPNLSGPCLAEDRTEMECQPQPGTNNQRILPSYFVTN